MTTNLHRDREQLDSGLEHVLAAPADDGRLELIVIRPAVDEREVLEAAALDLHEGLVGDNWRSRGSSATEDGSAHPEMQLNVMNARATDLVAGGDRERWPLAGDQLYLDLDLSEENLPAGTRLAIGDHAVIEVTPMPHTGCKKFVQRFGLEAMKFTNDARGKKLRLRGLCARVVKPGLIRTGDRVRKLGTAAGAGADAGDASPTAAAG